MCSVELDSRGLRTDGSMRLLRGLELFAKFVKFALTPLGSMSRKS